MNTTKQNTNLNKLKEVETTSKSEEKKPQTQSGNMESELASTTSTNEIRTRISGAAKKRMYFLIRQGLDRDEARVKALDPEEKKKIAEKRQRKPAETTLLKHQRPESIKDWPLAKDLPNTVLTTTQDTIETNLKSEEEKSQLLEKPKILEHNGPTSPKRTPKDEAKIKLSGAARKRMYYLMLKGLNKEEARIKALDPATKEQIAERKWHNFLESNKTKAKERQRSSKEYPSRVNWKSKVTKARHQTSSNSINQYYRQYSQNYDEVLDDFNTPGPSNKEFRNFNWQNNETHNRNNPTEVSLLNARGNFHVLDPAKGSHSKLQRHSQNYGLLDNQTSILPRNFDYTRNSNAIELRDLDPYENQSFNKDKASNLRNYSNKHSTRDSNAIEFRHSDRYENQYFDKSQDSNLTNFSNERSSRDSNAIEFRDLDQSFNKSKASHLRNFSNQPSIRLNKHPSDFYANDPPYNQVRSPASNPIATSRLQDFAKKYSSQGKQFNNSDSSYGYSRATRNPYNSPSNSRYSNALHCYLDKKDSFSFQRNRINDDEEESPPPPPNWID